MKEIFKFISKIGKLKAAGRRGWEIHGVENPETTAAHSFQLAMLVWSIGREKKDFDLNRAIKMALIHDICEVYSPDLTSYDAVAIDEDEEFTKEDVKDLEPIKGRPTHKQREKMEKVKEELEHEAIEKLLKDLPEDMKEEIAGLWKEYEKRVTDESRFVKQADKITNLLQGIEYWKQGIDDIEYKLWVRRAKETIDDPYLTELLIEIEESL
ncbi:MAG: HD domain-containing protein [Patescibacteria group bacterium]